MRHPELIEALHAAAEQKAATIWESARSEAEQCRVEAAHSVETRREEARQDLAATARKLEDDAIGRAEAEAKTIRIATGKTLAERAYRLASDSLPRFRDGGYESLFAALAGEIPEGPWRRVRVNPADLRLAQEFFPDAEIVPDESVTGGLEVEAEDGRIRISNTLETRLERAWPVVLPGLINDIVEEYSDHRDSS